MKQKSFIFLIIATYSSEVLSTNEEKTLEGKRSRGARQEAELLESAPQAKKASYGEQTFDSLNLAVGKAKSRFLNYLPQNICLDEKPIEGWGECVKWHEEKIGLLNNTKLSIKSTRNIDGKTKIKKKTIKKNMLMASLGLVLEIPSATPGKTCLKILFFEVPHFFISGWLIPASLMIEGKTAPSPMHEAIKEMAVTVRRCYLDKTTDLCQAFYSKNEQTLEREALLLKEHGQNLIDISCSFGNDCRSDDSEENDIKSQDIFFLKKTKNRIENSVNNLHTDLKSNKKQNFRELEFRLTDSEQALLCSLADSQFVQDEVIKTKFQEISASDGKLKAIILNIASLIECCSDCTTFFIHHSLKNSISKSIANAFDNLRKEYWQQQIASEHDVPIHTFITSSTKGSESSMYDPTDNDWKEDDYHLPYNLCSQGSTLVHKYRKHKSYQEGLS